MELIVLYMRLTLRIRISNCIMIAKGISDENQTSV
jgi:hypothetical protein